MFYIGKVEMVAGKVIEALRLQHSSSSGNPRVIDSRKDSNDHDWVP